MINMMKSNKDMVKQMYKAQGMDMSDEQFEMISGMMTPEMVKSASEMVTKNPDMLKSMPQAINGANMGTANNQPREEQKQSESNYN